MNRPKEMCKRRRARPLTGTEEAWWYINLKSIDIISVNKSQTFTQVRLYRKQLERALQIMDSVGDSQ